MATKLTKPVEREVQIAGVDKPVVLTFAATGVTARIKGTRTIIACSWTRLIEGMVTPSNIPSHLFGKPLELLRYNSKK